MKYKYEEWEYTFWIFLKMILVILILLEPAKLYQWIQLIFLAIVEFGNRICYILSNKDD